MTCKDRSGIIKIGVSNAHMATAMARKLDETRLPKSKLDLII
ncbi:unnamed protein product [Rhodiola kirilowii]